MLCTTLIPILTFVIISFDVFGVKTALRNYSARVKTQNRLEKRIGEEKLKRFKERPETFSLSELEFVCYNYECHAFSCVCTKYVYQPKF